MGIIELHGALALKRAYLLLMANCALASGDGNHPSHSLGKDGT